MKTKSIFTCSTLIAALLLAVGLVSQVQAQSTNAVAPAATPLALLDDAYTTLAQAKHDFNGHRVEAMHQIKLAVVELGGEVGKKGKGHEAKATAEAQVKAAQALVKQALPGLTGKALKHATEADKEITKALEVK
jgi:hypothetical protein